MITCWAFVPVSQSVCRMSSEGLKFDAGAHTVSTPWDPDRVAHAGDAYGDSVSPRNDGSHQGRN